MRVPHSNVYNFSYLGKEIDENGEVKAIIQQAQNVTSGTDGTIMFVPFLPLYKFPLIPGYQWQKQFQAKLTPELFPIGGGLDKNDKPITYKSDKFGFNNDDYQKEIDILVDYFDDFSVNLSKKNLNFFLKSVISP